MTVTAEEFLRRFLLHALPRGFVRIRFFGFLANRRRKHLLPLCRRLLHADQPDNLDFRNLNLRILALPALWRGHGSTRS